MSSTTRNSADRKIDLIDTNPRFTESEAIRLNNLFRGSVTLDMLRSVIRDGLAGDLAVVSSFGAESAVLLHLVASIDPSVPVLFLETGKHFPETVAYRDELIAHLGLTALQIVEPDPEVLAKKDENGLRWSWDPDGCCEIRKVEPLARALLHYDASLTGRKGFQSSTRAGLPLDRLRALHLPVEHARRAAALRDRQVGCAGAAQDQPAGFVEQGAARRLLRGARPSPPSARSAGLPLDRLRALHHQGRAG